MVRTGVIGEIRQRLVSGSKSRDLIEQGYRPGSVYKTQWQLRKNGTIHALSSDNAVTPDPDDGESGLELFWSALRQAKLAESDRDADQD